MKNLFHEVLIRAGWVGGLVAGLLGGVSVNAAVPSLAAEFSEAAASSGSSAASGRRWMTMPRVFGHLTAKDLGVVINTDDPYSVQVGEYYAKARAIPPSRVLRLSLPMKATLAPDEFEAFKKQKSNAFLFFRSLCELEFGLRGVLRVKA